MLPKKKNAEVYPDDEHTEPESTTICYERERTKMTTQIAAASDEAEKAKLTKGLERWTYLEKCYEAWSAPFAWAAPG